MSGLECALGNVQNAHQVEYYTIHQVTYAVIHSMIVSKYRDERFHAKLSEDNQFHYVANSFSDFDTYTYFYVHFFTRITSGFA